jgi:hypothetical protein
MRFVWTIALAAFMSGCPQTTSGQSGSVRKGCKCGNSYISCSDTCHDGETYRKRRR